MFTADCTTLPLFRRLLASWMAACVLTISLLAAAPSLHAELHADADHADHECAIVLFASGVTTSVAIEAQPAPENIWRKQKISSFEELVLLSPEYLQPMQCGPPILA